MKDDLKDSLSPVLNALERIVAGVARALFIALPPRERETFPVCTRTSGQRHLDEALMMYLWE